MNLEDAILLIKNNTFNHQTAPATWADFGCGSGLFSNALSQYLIPGSRIYAVDQNITFNPGFTKAGIKLIAIKADFIEDTLPFGKIDGILMANSFHYVKEKALFLKNIIRNHDPDIFLIIEYNTDIPVPQWVPYPVSFRSLEILFKNTGSYSIYKIAEHHSVFGRGNIYAALIEKKLSAE